MKLHVTDGETAENFWRAEMYLLQPFTMKEAKSHHACLQWKIPDSHATRTIIKPEVDWILLKYYTSLVPDWMSVIRPHSLPKRGILSAWASIMKYCRQDSLHKQKFISHWSRSWECKIKILANSISGASFLPGLLVVSFSLWPFLSTWEQELEREVLFLTRALILSD